MGWPMHDPEGWEEVCRNAIIVKMKQRGILGDTLSKVDADNIESTLTELRDEDIWGEAVWDALLDWASSEIGPCESEYMTRKLAIERSRQ